MFLKRRRAYRVAAPTAGSAVWLLAVVANCGPVDQHRDTDRFIKAPKPDAAPRDTVWGNGSPGALAPDGAQPDLPLMEASPAAGDAGTPADRAAIDRGDAATLPSADASAPPPDTGPPSCGERQISCSGGGCETTAWSFETGAENWLTPGGTNTNVVDEYGVTSERTHDGTRAYTARIEVTRLRGLFKLLRNFCGYTTALGGSQALDLRGKVVTAWVHLAATSMGDPDGRCRLLTRTRSGEPLGLLAVATPIPLDTWTKVGARLDEAQARDIVVIELACDFVTEMFSWRGNLYVDDVSITAE